MISIENKELVINLEEYNVDVAFDGEGSIHFICKAIPVEEKMVLDGIDPLQTMTMKQFLKQYQSDDVQPGNVREILESLKMVDK